MKKNYKENLNHLINHFSVDIKNGLTEEQVQKAKLKYGANSLEETTSKSIWHLLWHNLNNIIVYLLVIAMILSLIMGEWIEAGAVSLALLISILIGFFVELKAQKSVNALQDMIHTRVNVLRDGVEKDIDSSELVPGDIMMIRMGDAIAADGRLLKSNNLAVIESALTGESEAVFKDSEITFDSDVAVGDRVNMVFSGTAVTRGHARILVTDIGMNTEVGKISDMMAGDQMVESPLDKEIAKLGKSLIIVAFIAAALVIVVGLMNGQEFSEILHIAIILAVAAIPEAMPAVETITLSNGMKTMSKHQALVKTLSAVETLGATSVIASDKTGTLTENQMMVEEIITAQGEHFKVTGSGYEPKGHVIFNKQILDISIDPMSLNPSNEQNHIENHRIKTILLDAFLSSSARLEKNDANEQGYTIKGDPTDGAMKVLGYKAHLSPRLLEESGIQKINELPFDSQNKYMAVVYKWPNHQFQLLLKGAPDVIASLMKLKPKRQHFWEEKVNHIAEKGMRSLALATVLVEESEINTLNQDIISWIHKNGERFNLEALFGIVDPPRHDIAQSIKQTQEAGINIKMITGDHPKTASMIAKSIGIHNWHTTMTGTEIDKHHQKPDFIHRVNKTSVFARVSPENKLQLVKALQKNGEVVAMTGDGVNDAPALSGSDIAVAMGVRGTEVAKEASDMILTDDRYSTIVKAVREGRVIFENIKKYVSFLFTCNMVEIVAILLTIIFLLPMPLKPLHILWLNLLIDVGPAIALAYETAEKDVMQKPPRTSKDGLVNKKFLSGIILSGIIIGISAFMLFYYLYVISAYPLVYAQTATFTFMTVAQLLHIFNVRRIKTFGLDKTFFKNKFLMSMIGLSLLLQIAAVYLPFLQTILGTESLRINTIVLIIFAGTIVTLLLALMNSIYKHNENT